MAMDEGSGGGSSSSLVRAGGAFVELSAKNSMAAGLGSASQSINIFTQLAQIQMVKVRGEFDKSTASLKKLVAGIGLIAGGKMLLDAFNTSAMEKFNEQLEKSNVLTEKLIATEQRRRDKAMAAAGEGNNDQRIANFLAAQGGFENERGDLAGVRDRARERFEAVKKSQSILWGLSSVRELPAFIFGSAGREHTEAKGALDDAQRQHDAAQAAALAAGDRAKDAERFRDQQAKFGRMDEAVEFHSASARAIDAQEAIRRQAQESRDDLMQDAARRGQEAFDAMRGSFRGSFGGGDLRGAFGAQGMTASDPIVEAKRQTDLQEKLLEVQRKAGADIAKIAADFIATYGE